MMTPLFRRFFFLSSCVFCLLVYQNCSIGGFQGAYDQYSVFSIPTFSTTKTDANLVWSLRASSSANLFYTRLSQVSKWLDSTNKSVGLYPPTLADNATINIDAAPLVAGTDSGTLLNFGPNKYFTNIAGDLSYFNSQSASIVLYVRDIQFPSSGNPIRFFEMLPSDGSMSGQLALDISDLGNGNVTISASEYFDSTDYQTASITVTKSSLDKGIGLAVRYSNDPASLNLNLNGMNSTRQKVGAPPTLSTTMRLMHLHGASYGQEGSFNLAEFAFWSRELTDNDLYYYSSAIYQSYNATGTVNIVPPSPTPSPTPTPTPNPGPSPTPTPNPTPTLAFSDIRANFNVCLNCHTEVSSKANILAAVGANGTTPWIMPGNAAGSLIIKALSHQSGALPMPQGLTQLSTDQISQISSWIDQGAN